MNAQPEKVEQPQTDVNLAAFSDVEAGIRDCVRNDIAYLRWPGISALGEAGLLIASAEEPEQALAEAERALLVLLDGLQL